MQYRMRYAIYIINAKDLTIVLTMVVDGNTITFARANNSDVLRALNHLMVNGNQA